MKYTLPPDDLYFIQQKSLTFIDQLKNKSLFITGGTGFLGIWLLESLLYLNEKLQLNITIHALTRSLPQLKIRHPHLFIHSNIFFYQGDISDNKILDIKATVDIIIHGATDTSAKNNVEQPDQMLSTILRGTDHLLQLAKEKSVKKFLFLSSGAIYGQQLNESRSIKEDDGAFVDVFNKRSAYHEGKRTAELMCLVNAHHFDVLVARCFAFVGPYLPLNQHFALGNFILNALRDENIAILGDGTPRRSYLYAADFCLWIFKLLVLGENKSVYNIGSDRDYSLGELAQLTKVTLKKENISVDILGSQKESGNPHTNRYVPNIHRICRDLDLEVYTPLEEAIKKTYQWYKRKGT